MSSSPTKLEIPVTGGSLACLQLSDRDRSEPVLAIHGITSNSHNWLAVARALEQDPSSGVALFAVDLRGRGASNQLPAPYGLDAHVQDMVAALDRLGIERGVVVGHSLGAYVAARLAAAHPGRVRATVLVDGGLRVPGSEGKDPQEFLEAFLGPSLARLQMRFATREQYRAWWAAHPALIAADVDPADLASYADYDLVGEPPELRSGVREDAVRADAADLFGPGPDAGALTGPARLLCAPRGLQDGPNPMQPLEIVEAWAAEAPAQRRAEQVPDVNHYTIVLGASGSRAVAAAIAEATTAL